MNDRFIPFPTTPHLAWLGAGLPREDKLLSPEQVRVFLDQSLMVEEKVDGANLGLSFDSNGELRVQNRGSYLQPPYPGQFAKLESWLIPHLDTLFDVLGNRYVLFGEWCAIRHSKFYDRLPDWLLIFDVYDRQGARFLPVAERDAVAKACGLSLVPRLDRGRFTLEELKAWLTHAASQLGAGPPEGFVLRPADKSGPEVVRAKLVRAEFVQAIGDHWRGRVPEPNRLAVWQATRVGG